jgi:hypothetical protein
MKIPVSRVVAFVVTPLLTIVAGGAASLGAKYGLHVNPTDVTTYGVAAATAVVGLGLKWLHGSSLYERAALEASHYEKLAAAVDPAAVGEVEHAVETAAPVVVEKVEEALGAPADAFPPPADPAPAAAEPVAPAAPVA